MHSKMHEVTAIKNRLIEIAHDHVECDDISEIDTMELGRVIDIIKDLAEVEEKCWKAEEIKARMAPSHMEAEKHEHHDMTHHVEGTVHTESAPRYMVGSESNKLDN